MSNVVYSYGNEHNPAIEELGRMKLGHLTIPIQAVDALQATYEAYNRLFEALETTLLAHRRVNVGLPSVLGVTREPVWVCEQCFPRQEQWPCKTVADIEKALTGPYIEPRARDEDE
jgi:hypothetical protein